ncbi:Myo-inositol 2-dehydrogenase [Granulibacter bethesdensis]|nr:Myo-inositol 2-dehydrogenase [Granulibacter bethesdensis]
MQDGAFMDSIRASTPQGLAAHGSVSGKYGMLNVVQFGAGRIGHIHAANIAAEGRMRLARVVDPMTESASSMAALYGARVSDMGEALADPEIAGVIIASPTALHLDHAIAAARAGKAIFCEKPLDLDLDRVRAAGCELSDAVARLFLAFNRRFDPNFSELKRRLVSGAVGNLETIHIISHDPGPPPLSYVRSSGGIFKDMSIHDLDMARWLLEEEPIEVFASAAALFDPAIEEAGDFDTAKIILRTTSGKMCFISNSRRSGYGYDQRIEAFGSHGMVCARNVVETTVEQWGEQGVSADRLQNFFLERYASAYRAEMSHFADIMEGKVRPLIGYADGLRALELAVAAYKSATTRCIVQL